MNDEEANHFQLSLTLKEVTETIRSFKIEKTTRLDEMLSEQKGKTVGQETK